MSEQSDVTGPIVKALKRLPGVVDVIRIQSGAPKVRGGWMHCAPAGTPDLLVGVSGVYVWMESKTEERDLSAVQKQRHAEMRLTGARIYVVRSVSEALFIVQKLLGGTHAWHQENGD